MVSLSSAQKKQLFELGYVVVPNVVPREKLRSALRKINASIGQGMNKNEMEQFSNRSFCPELMHDPALMGLFSDTPALGLAESAIGTGKVMAPHETQIALRFPVEWDPVPEPWPHIDGFYTPLNGVSEGQIFNFTALAGIYLSDVDEDWAGNFTVWPGSHRLLEAHFQKNPPKPSLKDGIPPVELPKYELIKAKAGDLILCHYQLVHTAAVNVSPNVRYAVFYRLYHADQAKHGNATLTDIWRLWEGLGDFKKEMK